MNHTNSVLRSVFSEAVEIAAPAARAAFLESACKGDGALRLRVEQLLAADSRAGKFLQERVPATDVERVREKVGDRIGRYRLLERIGQGGYGVVYLAEQEEPVRRQVALKVIKLGMDTGAVIRRFEAERQALAVMDHPNIARVFDAGATEAGRPFFVMELVRGVPITDYCEREPLTIRERLELFIQVCNGIQHAHQKGIIHRDLKPSNILVTKHDGAPMPKVIDFGIAKATDRSLFAQATATGGYDFIGTPAYMSPEQVQLGSRDIDTRSDIYSLGVILYELMTGDPPFDPKVLASAGLDEMRRLIRESDPPRPSTRLTQGLTRAGAKRLTSKSEIRNPKSETGRASARRLLQEVRGDVDWIVMKCLEKDRARRYETANALATDIRRHLECKTIAARPPTAFYRFQKTVRRNRVGFTAVLVVALVLVAAVIVSSQLAVRATRAEREQIRLRGLAEAKAEESRHRLLRMNVADGNRLAEQDPLSALPWFVEALQMELDDPGREEDERLRISAALHYSPRLVHMTFHGKWIHCIAFSPDGTRLVTGANEYAARVWNANTGELLLRLGRQRGQIRSAQFSPDGKQLVTMDQTGTACVWNALTGERLLPFLRSKEYNAGLLPSTAAKLNPAACFSPDGKLVVTAWGSKSAVVWETSDGRLRHTLPHEQVVYHAAFSPDGRYIVSSGLDRQARIWDAQTGEPVAKPLPHGFHVSWAQFTPDGQRLMTVSERKRVQIWDWRNGRQVVPEMAHDVVIFHASFSPDGRRILTASWDMLARIWDVTTGQVIAQFEHPSGLVNAAFAPDGERIATACHDGIARVWRISRGRQTSISLPHGDEVDVVAFSPDGQRLVVGGRGGAVRVWDLAQEDERTWTFPTRDVVWAEFSKDGSKVVTAGGHTNQSFRVWDGKTGQALGPWLSHSSAVRKAIFSLDGSRVLTIGDGKTAHLWNATNGQELIPALQHGKRTYDADLSSDNQRIAIACDDSAAYLWNAVTGVLAARLPHSNSVTAIAFSPDGRLVATGGRDKAARLWLADSGQPASSVLPQTSTVRHLRFSPDGRRLATACYLQGATHGFAQLWDVATGKPIGEPMPHRDDIRTVEFSRDGRRIATASDDYTARVWDALTGEPISPPLAHRDSVVHAILTPDGRRLATLASSGEVRLWNARTGEPITMPIPHPHRHDRGTLSFSPDGRRLLIATGADMAYAREFVPDSSSIAELLLKASVLSGQRIHPSAGSVPIDSASLSNAWQELRARR